VCESLAGIGAAGGSSFGIKCAHFAKAVGGKKYIYMRMCVNFEGSPRGKFSTVARASLRVGNCGDVDTATGVFLQTRILSGG
jgi:hypothetical protein